MPARAERWRVAAAAGWLALSLAAAVPAKQEEPASAPPPVAPGAAGGSQVLIDEAARRGAELAQAIELLPDRSAAPASPDQLPPADLCADCAELWLAFDALLSVREEAPPAATLTAETARAELDRIERRRAGLCDLRWAVLAFDAERVEREHRYFTWTETWASVDGLRRALRSPELEAFCR